jgi:hypothetical protein
LGRQHVAALALGRRWSLGGQAKLMDRPLMEN